jgi:DNA-binding transcriptional LysR family regulator
MDYFAALNAFVKAAELGSFSRVAELELSKVSTVSRYVKHLEVEMGAALFERGARRLSLTDAGMAFYERAVRLLADLGEARAITRALTALPQGLLRVSMPGALGRRHIMPQLDGFMRAYPEIRVDAVLTDAAFEPIDTDVAIRISVLGDPALQCTRLAPHRRVLVASPDYLARHGTPLTLSDIRGHQCLRYSLQSTSAWFFRPQEQADAAWSEVPIHARVRVNDSEALLAAALGGVGLGLLPWWMVAREVAGGRLARVLPEWIGQIEPDGDAAIWAVFPSKIVPPKVRAFVGYLTETLSRLPPP